MKFFIILILLTIIYGCGDKECKYKSHIYVKEKRVVFPVVSTSFTLYTSTTIFCDNTSTSIFCNTSGAK